jgi:hypothetical protein
MLAAFRNRGYKTLLACSTNLKMLFDEKSSCVRLFDLLTAITDILSNQEFKLAIGPSILAYHS